MMPTGRGFFPWPDLSLVTASLAGRWTSPN
jgi:hypothetical protein